MHYNSKTMINSKNTLLSEGSARSSCLPVLFISELFGRGSKSGAGEKSLNHTSFCDYDVVLVKFFRYLDTNWSGTVIKSFHSRIRKGIQKSARKNSSE